MEIKNAEVVIRVPDKDFKTKAITSDKEGHFIYNTKIWKQI